MIDLTPLEVRQKKSDFRRAVRGYDPELVNDFLDLVADRMEELVRENLALSDRVGALESELEDFQRKEQALTDALMSAQKMREDSRVHAEKESDLLMREAKAAAMAARDEAARALAREEETLRQVRARRQQLVESFRRLLERELTELEVIEETLELRARGEGAGRTGRRGPPAQLEADIGYGEPTRGPHRTGAAPGPAGPSDAPGSGGAGVSEAAEGAGAEGADAGAAAEAADAGDAAGGDAGVEDARSETGPVDGDLEEDWLSTLVQERKSSKEQSRPE